jgi:hypothetical protein
VFCYRRIEEKVENLFGRVLAAASSSRATWRTIVRASAHQLATVGSEMKTFHSDKALPGSVLDSTNPQRLHQFQQVSSVQPERLGRGRAIALRAPERVDD